MRLFYSPLRYPGGKNCIFPFVSELIRENGLVGCSYAEPFAGGAGLALHLLLDEVVSEIFLNDLDRSIYCFWLHVLEDTEKFCDWINTVSINMETWSWAKGIYNNMAIADSFDLAKATFYLNRTNVSGIITGGPIGGPDQTGKYKIDARFNRVDLINRIIKISNFKHKIHISCLDGVEFLKFINRKRKQIFIYIDPPYVKKGADLYMNFFEEKDHVALKNQILKMKKNWLVSYDNNEFIQNLYNGLLKYVYTLSQCTSNRIGDELIILGPTVRATHSLKNLKGPQKV